MCRAFFPPVYPFFQWFCLCFQVYKHCLARKILSTDGDSVEGGLLSAMGNRHWGGPGGGGVRNMLRRPPAPPGVLPGQAGDNPRYREVLQRLEQQALHPSSVDSQASLEEGEGLGDVSRFISGVWDQDHVEGGLRGQGEGVLVEHAEKFVELHHH